LTHEGSLRLLLKSGVSTAATVNEVSGRGVGLDAVREIVAGLRGEIDVRTVRGAGTTVEISVPVTVSSRAAILVEVGSEVAAIPLDSVERTARCRAREIVRAASGDSIEIEGAALPIAHLGTILGLETSFDEVQGGFSAVVVRGAEARCALAVDRIRGTTELVIRPLPPWLGEVSLIAGIAFDASGDPLLVIDGSGALGAVRASRRTGETRHHRDSERKAILVIDDSLTTRMLEQSILTSAGYEVDLAVSGEEALVKSRTRPYALFVVDVEMPGMSGIDFIRQARSDETLRAVPAILVTSLGSAQDREIGAAAGARAYIVKSEFDQDQFLRTVRELVR
jgi:two-component system chemotaxis sensor kinase CheA